MANNNQDFTGPLGQLNYIKDSDLLLTARETEEINATVYNVIWREAICQKIFPTIPIRAGAKTHKLTIAKEPLPPLFTQDFLKESLDVVRRTELTFHVAYMHKDFMLSKVAMDASRTQKYYNMDVKLLHLRVIAETMASYKERVFWRGHAIGGQRDSDGNFAAIKQGSINSNVVGIMNTTGVQTFAAGSNDGKTGNAGDGPLSISYAMVDLITKGYYGPYDVILSPFLYAQFILNRNSTTFQTDLERMLSMVNKDKQAIIRKIWVTPYVMAATDDGTASTMVVLQRKTPRGEPTVVLGEEYPIRHYPMDVNPMGIRGKFIWGGTAMVIRPLAITMDVDIDADA